jgi:Do/DeqQ family serine protease
LTAFCLIAALAAGCRPQREREPQAIPPPSQSNSASGAPAATRIVPRTAPLMSYADTVDRVVPAVVTIRSARRVRSPQQFPFFSDPFFRRFFGEGNAPRRAPDNDRQQVLGLGSGVLVSHDGYLLTNHHVIDGAEEISIEMPDRRTFEARLVGSDPPSDLAVLRMSGRDFPILPLGNSDDTRVGDVVLAIGNPLGIGQTVTMGIISAKGRATGLSDGSFEDFLQTDAPINRGNSGGALVNTNGELIGINSQILSPTGANIGIGFAIPSNMARGVWDQIVQHGRVRRGQLGIQVGGVSPQVADRLNLRDRRGVFVAGVGAGSAAERGGLKQDDVIVKLNGKPVIDVNSFRNLISSTAPGTQVSLTVVRNGREQDLRVTLGEFTPPKEQRRPDDDDER